MRSSAAPVTATSLPSYAPRPDLSALATGLRVDHLDANRVELEPLIGSFPTLANLLATPPINIAYDNVANFSALSTSSGQLVPTITGTGDFNSSVHTGPFMTRHMPYSGQAFRFTMHVSGTMPSTNSQGLGIGLWETVTAAKTARMAAYYTSSAVKAYSGFGATESGTSLGGGAADVTTGLWLEVAGDGEGTFTSRYQVAAYNTGVAPRLRRPASGWTTAQTSSRFFRDGVAAPWTQLRYGLHAIKTAGADFSGLKINHWDDTLMAPIGIRRACDGVGIGFSATSPEITLVDARPVNWTVCTQTALRSALAAVANLRPWESGTVEFQIDGGSWVDASAAPVGSGTTTTIKARLVSAGLAAASIDIGAIQALRLT